MYPAAQISRMIGAKARARRFADTMCDNAPGALPLWRENGLVEGISIVDSPVASVGFGLGKVAPRSEHVARTERFNGLNLQRKCGV